MSSARTTDKFLHPSEQPAPAPGSPLPEELRAKVRAWQKIQDQAQRSKPCRRELILKNESVWCELRDQWISDRACLFCSSYEPFDGDVPTRTAENSVFIVGARRKT